MGMFDWLKRKFRVGSINVCNAPFGDIAFDCKNNKFNMKKKTVDDDRVFTFLSHQHQIPRSEYVEMKLQMMRASRKPKTSIPLIATGVGIAKHKELYLLANQGVFTDGKPYLIYDKNAIYFGCHLEHYKWSWKLNKAVRL